MHLKYTTFSRLSIQLRQRHRLALFPLNVSTAKSLSETTTQSLTLIPILTLGLTPMLSAHILYTTRASRFRITSPPIYTLGGALTLTTTPSTPTSAFLAYSVLLGFGAGTITITSSLLGPLSGCPPFTATVVTTLHGCDLLGTATSTANLLADEFVRALSREGFAVRLCVFSLNFFSPSACCRCLVDVWLGLPCIDRVDALEFRFLGNFGKLRRSWNNQCGAHK
jgi:hypothetical protein